MKSSLGTSFLKATLLIVLFASCLSGPTGAQAGGKDPLSPGPVRPGNSDYRTELPQGYLKVYSATDRFNDGDARYFPHSSYAIYFQPVLSARKRATLRSPGSLTNHCKPTNTMWLFSAGEKT